MSDISDDVEREALYNDDASAISLEDKLHDPESDMDITAMLSPRPPRRT